MLRRYLLQVTTASGLLLAQGLAADPPNPVETKLREGLRNTMLQLRDVQGQLAAAQAAQIEAETKNKELEAKLAEQAKQLTADKAASDSTISGLTSQVAERDAEIARLSASLAKWKQGYDKLVVLAKATEAKRAASAEKVILLDRKVADQQLKNRQMFDLGNEILVRYEKFGLGDALTAREPFVGLTRVKFQNLIQDYQDKLTDTKIKP